MGVGVGLRTCLLTGGRTRHTDIAVDSIDGSSQTGGNGQLERGVGGNTEGEKESKISIWPQLRIKKQGSFRESSPPK